MTGSSVAGVRFWYDRLPVADYGSFEVPHSFKPQDQDKLAVTIENWLGHMRDAGLAVTDVATAGTYVAKGGMHGQGLALDIDAVRLVDGAVIQCKRDGAAVVSRRASDAYCLIDCILRESFYVVLDGWYLSASGRRDHQDHWHCDLTPGLQPLHGGRSTCVAVQGILHSLGEDPGAIDGYIGPRTEEAYYGVTSQAEHEPGRMILGLKQILLARVNATAVAKPDDPTGATTPNYGMSAAWDWASTYGICDGTRPDDPATRREVATMILRALKIDGGPHYGD